MQMAAVSGEGRGVGPWAGSAGPDRYDRAIGADREAKWRPQEEGGLCAAPGAPDGRLSSGMVWTTVSAFKVRILTTWERQS